ncbi:MAG: efflux RND transporter periplasmic adaptor subunit [Desulfobacterota bacterium]|nr:efflux RND transporter periplasmic adaptor subunit [Thermodesulfobacteriota bacterium]
MKSDKRVFVMAFFLVSLIISGCDRNEQGTSGQASYLVDPAQLEKVIPVIADELYRGVGTVKSKNTAQLSSKIMGYVSEIKVKEGDSVNTGDLLIVIKSKEIESRYEAAQNALLEIERNLLEAEAAETEAEAQFQLADITFKRFEELNQRGSVSLQEFDQVKANYEMAKARKKRTEAAYASLAARKKQMVANLEEAKTFYSYTQIRAPFTGLISRKMVAEGDLASPGTPLLIIEDNHHYQLEVFVNESQAGKIK